MVGIPQPSTPSTTTRPWSHMPQMSWRCSTFSMKWRYTWCCCWGSRRVDRGSRWIARDTRLMGDRSRVGGSPKSWGRIRADGVKRNCSGYISTMHKGHAIRRTRKCWDRGGIYVGPLWSRLVWSLSECDARVSISPCRATIKLVKHNKLKKTGILRHPNFI